MGVCNLYCATVHHLRQNPTAGKNADLSVIAARQVEFAYVGERRKLCDYVRGLARRIAQAGESEEQVLEQWYGAAWRKNSGSFPDFVLASESVASTTKSGAMIELKDTKERAIASFNSTLPARFKRISELSRGVRQAVQWYEARSGFRGKDERECYYLVRTGRQTTDWRISLVNGAFFETLPTSELLKELLLSLMRDTSVDEQTKIEIAREVAARGRESIAISRSLDNASIKPRLRIMAEVNADGNPHTYEQIIPRTVNLFLKENPEPQTLGEACQAARLRFVEEGVDASQTGGVVYIAGIPSTVHLIKHRRNGNFVVVQCTVP